MKKMILCGSLLLLFLIGFVPATQSQVSPQGKLGFMVNGGYSMPLFNLSQRYKGTYNIDGGINYGITERLGVEVRLSYGKFSKNASTSNTRTISYVINQIPRTFGMPPLLQQHLNLAGLTSSMTIGLLKSSSIKPYLIAGVGMYRIDSYRGSAVPWTALYNPGDPKYVPFHNDYDPVSLKPTAAYPMKHLTDWAWGLNGGLGVAIPVGTNASIDIKARYESIMADLWPVIFFGMEQVRPIQNLQLTGGITFSLR